MADELTDAALRAMEELTHGQFSCSCHGTFHRIGYALENHIIKMLRTTCDAQRERDAEIAFQYHDKICHASSLPRYPSDCDGGLIGKEIAAAIRQPEGR